MARSFVVIDRPASQAIVGDSQLQAVEFDHGLQLAELLAGERSTIDFYARFDVVEEADGLFLLGPDDTDENHYVIFDLTTCAVFSGDRVRALTSLQRVLRFALKHWAGTRLSNYVRRPQGTTKAIVFPFPIATRQKYRVVVEVAPKSARVTKRFGSKNLLVFEDGFEQRDDVADLRQFKRAFEALPAARAQSLGRTQAPSSAGDFVQVTTLDQVAAEFVTPYLGYDKWRDYLTRPQAEFIDRLPSNPERIEGPAGTGKTLCLILKCIHALNVAREREQPYRAVFFAHSAATESTIKEVFLANCDFFEEAQSMSAAQSLTVTTLQSWCGDLLGQRNISATQYLDQDAMTAKELRRLMIEDAIQDVIENELPTHRRFVSPSLISIFDDESLEILSDMVQHEIAIMIKGRAQEDLDTYQQLPFVDYGVACKSSDDRAFIYIIYERYAAELARSGEFDTDDVVLTALGHLQTPIWRRRRRKDGYSAIFVDETHLFNLNELSVFHLLTHSAERSPIVYSIDRSQAPGDRGLTNALVAEIISGRAELDGETEVKTVFRSSPDIVSLATCVTASGASLFFNFDDPLQNAQSAFSSRLELKCAPPRLVSFPTDQDMCEAAFRRADAMAAALSGTRSDILIVVFARSLLDSLKRISEIANKPIEVLEHRGDLEHVRAASKHSRHIVALPDYVGGLEFDGVILVGVDEGRVPPGGAGGQQSRHYLNFRAHNRVYVAISRAKYRVEVLINSTRGLSGVLGQAAAEGLLIDAG